MSSSIEFGNLHTLEAPGTWVGTGRWATAASDALTADYAVERTRPGLFKVAVRGFEGGEPHALTFGENGTVDVEVDGANYALDQVEHKRLFQVDPELIPAYIAAVESPEEPTDPDQVRRCSFARVIEQGLTGVWSIGFNDEGNAWAKLVYESAGQVGIHPYNQSGWNFDTRDFYEPDPRIYSVDVVKDGPLVTLIPHVKTGILAVTANAIQDRITRANHVVRETNNVDSERRKLSCAIMAVRLGVDK